MTNDKIVTDKIMTHYMTFLLSGHTIKHIEIRSVTIKGYMKMVNTYYKDHGLNLPFEAKSDSNAAKLLAEQETIESDPARRDSIPDLAWQKWQSLQMKMCLDFDQLHLT